MVVPRRHASRLEHISEQVPDSNYLKEVAFVGMAILKEIHTLYNKKGEPAAPMNFKMYQNNGWGQVVPHVHFHFELEPNRGSKNLTERFEEATKLRLILEKRFHP